jgi:hypothetical protein
MPPIYVVRFGSPEINRTNVDAGPRLQSNQKIHHAGLILAQAVDRQDHVHRLMIACEGQHQVSIGVISVATFQHIQMQGWLARLDNGGILSMDQFAIRIGHQLMSEHASGVIAMSMADAVPARRYRNLCGAPSTSASMITRQELAHFRGIDILAARHRMSAAFSRPVAQRSISRETVKGHAAIRLQR